MLKNVRAYYILTKPGIIRGNAIHVIAGMLFAAHSPVPWAASVAVLVGTCLVIASACVANNYMDRDIDVRMKRTQSRPSVTGEVPIASAMMFTAILLIFGMLILAVYTNAWVVAIGVAAYILYVFVYGWAKRNTSHSTLVGAIPGALPIAAGHVAIVGVPTLDALMLLLLVFTWQMPHFYAISLFRKNEYQAAKIPVLGAIVSFKKVQIYMFMYMLAYFATIFALIYLNIVGIISGLVLLAGATGWLLMFITFSSQDEARWAKSIFKTSLVLALLLLVASVIDVLLPPVV